VTGPPVPPAERGGRTTAYPRTAVGRAAAGVRRRAGTGLVALLCAWSGLWLALWLLVATGVLGALFGFLGAALVGGTFGGPGGGVLAAAGGALAGIVEALVATVRSLVVDQPAQLAVSLGGGLAVALVSLAVVGALEPWLLRLGGCRRMSRREAARLGPLLDAAARDLGLDSTPQLLMSDAGSLRVRTHIRHLVVGRSLLVELGEDPPADAALAAIICHALHHWAAGDGVADRWVFLAGLPLALVYNAGCRLAEQGNALISLVGWAVLWPAWVLVHLLVRPVAALGSRRREHDADVAVRAAERGEALHRALSFLGELEPGRSGWDRALAAGQPPLELRLETLEPAGEAQ
jgi:hypothetical protein